MKIQISVLAALLASAFSACGGGDSAGKGPGGDPQKDQGGDPTPTHEHNPPTPPNGCRFMAPSPQPEFKSIQTAFANTSDILSSPDVTGTLLKLRQVASPDEKYQSELETVADAAATLTVEQLQLLVSAAYFSARDEERISAELPALLDKIDDDSCQRRANDNRDLRQIQTLGYRVDNLILASMPKLPELRVSEAERIVNSVFAIPFGMNQLAVEAAVNRLRSEEWQSPRLTTLLVAADRRGATSAVARLGAAWFKANTNRSVDALVELAGKVHAYGKGAVIRASLDVFPSLTVADIVRLAQAAPSPSDDGGVAAEAFKRIDGFSHGKVLVVAQGLGEDGKAAFAEAAILQYPSLTTQQLLELLAVSSSGAGRVAFKAGPKVSDLTVDRIILVAGKLKADFVDSWLQATVGRLGTVSPEQAKRLIQTAPYEGFKVGKLCLAELDPLNPAVIVDLAGVFKDDFKDGWVEFSITKIDAVTTSEALSLLAAGRYDRWQILKALFPKIRDLSIANILRINDRLADDSKDAWVELAITQIPTVTTAEALSLLAAGRYDRWQILKALFPKVRDLTIANTLKINDSLPDDSKDGWLQLASQKISSVSTDELLQLLAGAKYDKYNLLKGLAARLSDLSAANTVRVAETLDDNVKDGWVELQLGRLAKVTTAEALQLMRAGKYDRYAIVVAALPKISDWGLPTVLQIGRELPDNEKDGWVGKNLPKFTSLKTDEFLALLGAAKYDVTDISRSQLPKVKDLTVNNALRINQLQDDSAKDSFLLKAVELVTDLSYGNLKSLSDAGKYEKDEIYAQGKKRLGG